MPTKWAVAAIDRSRLRVESSRAHTSARLPTEVRPAFARSGSRPGEEGETGPPGHPAAPPCTHDGPGGIGNSVPLFAAKRAASSSLMQSCICMAVPKRAAGSCGGSPIPNTLGFSIARAVMQLRVSALSPPASADIIAILMPMALSGARHSNGRASMVPGGALASGMFWTASIVAAPMASRKQETSDSESTARMSPTVVLFRNDEVLKQNLPPVWASWCPQLAPAQVWESESEGPALESPWAPV